MEFKLDILNSNRSDMTLIVEPWAEEFYLPSRGRATILIEAPEPGTPEIETKGKYFICWLWSGSVADVYVNGELVSHGLMRSPFP